MVQEGQKFILRCPLTYEDEDVKWYRDATPLRGQSSRIRVLKQTVRFKRMEMMDEGNYGCRMETGDSLEWRNVTIRVEGVQNDGYQSESAALGSVMGALRPEEETNELDIGARSESIFQTNILSLRFGDYEPKNPNSRSKFSYFMPILTKIAIQY